MIRRPGNDLEGALAAARAALAADPDGHLILGARRRIWAALGPPWQAGRHARLAEGLLRRADLALRCARFVLPIWEHRHPGSHSIVDLLATIEGYLAGRTSAEDLVARAEGVWDLADRAEYRGPDATVASAAAMAALTALHDERFDAAAIDPAATERDPALDCYDMDAAYWAATAYSGGNPVGRAPTFDPARSREFWTWYLDVAVAAAGALGPQGS